ncbi:MAG: hypothetical protein INR69_15675 [Mucilaginibacter polytrichastri]|nr:hypothetical protein [Mucilaginibacter polytrichastri]
MKKAFLPGLTLVVTVVLVYALVRYMGMRGFPFAFALNFILMACVLIFMDTLKSPLNAPYFEEKAWEKRGKVYTLFGVGVYRKLLVVTGWEKLNRQAKPVKHDAGALSYLYYRTKQDELGHLVILLIVSGFTVFVAFRFGMREALWLLGLNVLLNLYPIFLQRANRPRIERVMKLAKR